MCIRDSRRINQYRLGAGQHDGLQLSADDYGHAVKTDHNFLPDTSKNHALEFARAKHAIFLSYIAFCILVVMLIFARKCFAISCPLKKAQPQKYKAKVV